MITVEDLHKQKLSVVSTQTAEYQDDQDKISIMMDLIIRQDQCINELSNQVLSLQARSMKRNIIINGLKEADKENCKETSINFLKNKMKIEDIDVEVAHCIGAGTDQPMVVSFKNTAEKSKVFGKVKNLKGVKNEDDKSYQIDDQLPEEMSEKKKQIRTHIKNMNIELSVKKGVLTIGGKTYKKEICAPNAEVMLTADKEKVLSNKLDIHEGKTIFERSSKFIGYAVEVENIKQVEAAYYKVRRMHGRAHHVTCGYKLTDTKNPVGLDGDDDREFGAFRNISDYIKSQKLMNIALFVV